MQNLQTILIEGNITPIKLCAMDAIILKLINAKILFSQSGAEDLALRPQKM